MDPDVARGIAHHHHAHQRTRAGSLVTEHIERVAAGAPDEARSVAFLHDVLERSPVGIGELVDRGLTPLELAALQLHLSEARGVTGVPPYAWARSHIAFAQDRRGEAAAARATNPVMDGARP